MQQRNALLGSESGQCRLQSHRLVHRFLHEALGRGLSPGTERGAAEAARESLRTGNTDTLDLARLAIQNPDADVGENAANELMLARLVVVVAEDGDYRDPHRGLQVVRQDLRLFLEAVVGQIAAQQKDVSPLVDVRQQRLQLSPRGFFHVQIADGCQARCLLSVQ